MPDVVESIGVLSGMNARATAFRLPLPIARFVQRSLQRIGINACADGFGSEPGKGVKRIAQGFALFGFYPAALGVEFVERGGVSGGKLFQGRLKAIGRQDEGGFQAASNR